MTGTLTSLLLVEGALTIIFAVMLIIRSFEGMKEEDHLVLTEAERHLDRDQAAIRHKVDVLTKYIRVAGVLWSVLAVVLVGMYVAKGLALI